MDVRWVLLLEVWGAVLSKSMFEWVFIAGEIASVVFKLLYLGLIIGTIVVVVLDNRNPVKTMSWILVLMFLPVVGLILYFFFGRSHRHERIISKRSYSRLLKKPMAEYLAQEEVPTHAQYQRLMDFFRLTNQSLPFEGNQVTLYTSGQEMLKALLQAISEAKHHIHLEFYIIEDDRIGRKVREALIAKAQQGVEVKVIYDDVGCWKVPRLFFQEMRANGIEVYSFLKVFFPLFTSKVNYRNHRKIVVVDGKVGFIGGMNLAERYVDGVAWGSWHDAHLRLEGRAVHGLQTTFLLDWYFVDRSLLTSKVYFPKQDRCGSSLVQVVAGDPVSPWRELMQGLMMALGQAKRYFYIQTPYFLPTESLLIAMQSAALAGVDVRLMIPKRADSRLTHWASCSYLKDVLLAGVKVYFYQPGFLHSKLMVSDDTLFCVGSANLDFRSFEHNFEVNAYVYDSQSAPIVREAFLKDQQACEQVALRAWQQRPWYRKSVESVVRLMAPLL